MRLPVETTCLATQEWLVAVARVYVCVWCGFVFHDSGCQLHTHVHAYSPPAPMPPPRSIHGTRAESCQLSVCHTMPPLSPASLHHATLHATLIKTYFSVVEAVVDELAGPPNVANNNGVVSLFCASTTADKAGLIVDEG